MVRKKFVSDLIFSEEVPEKASQIIREALRSKKSMLTLTKSENTIGVDCTRKGTAAEIAYLSLVLGLSDKRSQIGGLIGLLLSIFTNPDDEGVLDNILVSVISKLDNDDDLEAAFASVLTCRAVRDDVIQNVAKAKQTETLDSVENDKNTPFWFIPEHNTLH